MVLVLRSPHSPYYSTTGYMVQRWSRLQQYDWPLPGKRSLPLRQWRFDAVPQSIQLQHLREHAIRGPAYRHWFLLRHRWRLKHGHCSTVRLDIFAGILRAVPSIREPQLRHLHRIIRRTLRSRIRRLFRATKRRHN